MIRRRSALNEPHLIAVNRFYWPDHSATSQLLTDLCERAASNAMRVTVVTSRMRYDDPKARLLPRDHHAGVQIRRVWTTRLGRSWTPARAVDYISFALSSFFAVFWLARKGDLVLVKTDPPLLSVPLRLAVALRGAKQINWLQDLFPEVAASLGVTFAEGPIGRALKWLRNCSLNSAAVNVAISEGMARRLSSEGVPRSTIRVHPNWAERKIVPVTKEANELRRRWFPDDRLVIGYSGNLGRAHAVSAVCDLVKRTADIPELAWLFIGGGSGMEAVRKTAERSGAIVRFEPYQPRSLLALSLSASDVHLVSFDPACEELILPSKLYGIMAAGRGVISLGSAHGEVAQEVQQGAFGVVLDIERPETWCHQISQILRSDVAEELGRRARRRFDAVYAPAQVLDGWMQTLLSVAASPRRGIVPDWKEAAPSLRRSQT